MKPIRIILLFILLVLSRSADTQAKSRRWKVREISFTGNSTFSNREISDLMELKAKWPLFNDNFSEFRLRSDLSAIEDFYRSQGFLNVDVRAVEISRDESSRRVRINIGINEGERTLIGSVQIVLPQLSLDSTLYRQIWSRPDKPFIRQMVEDDATLLERRIAEKGYLEANTNTEIIVDSASHTAVIRFNIKKGPKISVGDIHIEGVEKINPLVITRELQFKSGEVLTLGRLRKSEMQLYRTNLFSLINIEPELGVLDTSDVSFLPDSAYPIRVRVNEADFFRAEIGAGYGSLEGFRGSLRASYGNLFRVGHRLAFKGNLSRRVQFAELVYTMPWFLSLPWQFDGSVYFNRFDDEENTYFGVFRGINLAAGRESDFGLAFRIWLNWEAVEILPEENTQSVGLDLIYDTRNDLIDPVRGGLNLFQLEIAGLTGFRSSQFLKVINDSRIFWNIRNLRFASGLKLGYARPFGATETVPTQERFFAGGPRSVRGFQEGHIRENPDGSSKSGTLQLIANIIDFRFPLFWWFQGALFLDAGYVWDEDEVLNTPFSELMGQVRWGTGLGLRLNTPIAVIRLDVGFKINRQPEERPYELHLDIGQAF